MPSDERIEVNPRILAGKPVIKGTRVPVHLILERISTGATFEEILSDYPQLKRRDIEAAVHYASRLIESGDWVGYGVV